MNNLTASQAHGIGATGDLVESTHGWLTSLSSYSPFLLLVLQFFQWVLPFFAANAKPSTAFTHRTWDEAYALASGKVAQMTVDEKIGILTGLGIKKSRCVGNTHPVPRLDIPSLCMNDGPAGMRLTKGVTGFPAGINAASTFSRRLIEARGRALGQEFRGKGVHIYLGPAMDLMRNPKMGRAWESFGPDPFLSGEGAYYTITGVQSAGVTACAKHLIANNQEHWRYGLSSDLDQRTAQELYFYPFLRSIEANVGSIMCAYNRVNQTSACHNAEVLGMLNKAGFKGFVVSDWGATHDGPAENANAGLDMEQPGDFFFVGGGVFSGLRSAVNNGKISQARLTDMVTRVLAPYYRLGQDQAFPPVNFDIQRPDGDLNSGVSVRLDDHTDLAREIASASAVLLKNARTNSTTKGLPLNKKEIKTLAVIGLDAKMPNKNCDPLNKCNEGTMSIGWGSGTNSLEFLIPPIDAIKQFIGKDTAITESLANDVNAGITAARDKDAALVFVFARSGELGAYDVVVGNMGDRNDLNLWWNGGRLVERVAAVCSNTIVVVHSVGPVLMPWSSHPNVTGVIYAGTPGEQTGPSIVDVLYGKYNPRGRLPFSIADDETAYPGPIIYNSGGFPTITYDEKLLLDYRFMDSKSIKPRFEFGFGLSYTTFSYSGLCLTAGDGGFTASFEVKNTGAVIGTEIAQLYLGYPTSAGEPKRVLRGFKEVLDLGAGVRRTVTISVSERDMSVWDVVKQGYVKPAGSFTIWIGASIEDIRLSGTL